MNEPKHLNALSQLTAAIGTNIKHQRTRQKLKLREIAEATGISIGHISAIEKGKINTLTSLHKIATALNTTILHILADAIASNTPNPQITELEEQNAHLKSAIRRATYTLENAITNQAIPGFEQP